MAAGDYRIGLDGVFFHGAAGTTAATESDNVRNVNLNLSKRLSVLHTWLTRSIFTPRSR